MSISTKKFLMYRVELKVPLTEWVNLTTCSVPNVPCGVESTGSYRRHTCSRKFLMYRVELKDSLKENWKREKPCS